MDGNAGGMPFTRFCAELRVSHFLKMHPLSFNSNYDGIIVFKILSQLGPTYM